MANHCANDKIPEIRKNNPIITAIVIILIIGWIKASIPKIMIKILIINKIHQQFQPIVLI